jgi:hypothetical protein
MVKMKNKTEKTKPAIKTPKQDPKNEGQNVFGFLYGCWLNG